MNITSAQYVNYVGLDGTVHQNAGIVATVNGVETAVPLDSANSTYAEIMRQVDEGTLTIQDADD